MASIRGVNQKDREKIREDDKVSSSRDRRRLLFRIDRGSRLRFAHGIEADNNIRRYEWQDGGSQVWTRRHVWKMIPSRI